MFKSKPSKPVLLAFAFKRLCALQGSLFVISVSLGFVLVYLLTATPLTASAATSSTINFQARLEGSGGQIAPDGNYNVEFKLYDASSSSGSSQGSCSGDAHCEWTEDYTYNSGAGSSDARIHVANGYLTVNLGSITAFPSTIKWDQQQWLTMDIGGTTGSGTITWDGEMNPRLLLTATPYAFSAGQLQNTSSSNSVTLQLTTPTASGEVIMLPDAPSGSATVCYQASSACGFATGTGAAFLQGGNSFSGTTAGELGTNNNGVLNFRTNNTDKLRLDTTGNLQFQQASTINIASATTGTQLTIQGGAATSGTNTGGNLLLQGGAGASTGASGSVIVKSNTNNSTSAFQVQNASGSNLFTVDTSNGNLVLGNDGTPSALTVRGGAATGNNVGGADLTVDASNGTGAAGSGDLIFRTAAPASNAITLDAHTEQGCGPNTCTYNHTVTSQTNRILFVQVMTNFGLSTDDVASVTYNGTNLTELTTVTRNISGNPTREDIWYLVNPASGTHSVVVTGQTGDNSLEYANTVSFYNVDQTTPISNLLTDSASGGSISENITSQTGQLIVDFSWTPWNCAQGNPGAGQTIIWQYCNIGASTKPGQSGTTNMSWVMTGDWVYADFALNPIANSSADTLQDRLHITNTGNVGIGTSTPTSTLDVHSNSSGAGTSLRNDGFGNILNLYGNGGGLSAYVNPYGFYIGGGIWSDTNDTFFCLRSCGAQTLQSGGQSVFGTYYSTTPIATVDDRGTLAVSQNVAFQKGTDYSATGTSNDVNFGTASLYRLTGASAQTITGIANGTDGQLLTLINAASQAATISNANTGSSAANRILTGTGGDISLPADASITLVYDAGTSRWRVTGSAAGTGGYILLQGSTPGTSQIGNFNINGTGIAGTLQASTFDASSAAALAIGNTNASSINVGKTSSNILTTINGRTLLKPTSGNDSTSAFQVQNAAGSNLFTADTTNTAIVLGNDTTPSALTVRGGAASGSNVAGGNITFDASNGTGSGGSGDIIFRTAPADNGITFDATTNADGGGPTLSWSHTTTINPDRVLVVGVTHHVGGTSITGVTYGGTALTQIGSEVVNGSTAHVSMWYLKNPASGAHTITVTASTLSDK